MRDVEVQVRAREPARESRLAVGTVLELDRLRFHTQTRREQLPQPCPPHDESSGAASDLLECGGMLVLHVVAPGEVGGLERVVQLLAQGQAHAGDDVHVAAVLDRGHEDHWLLRTLAAAGVGTHSIVVPNRAYWRER